MRPRTFGIVATAFLCAIFLEQTIASDEMSASGSMSSTKNGSPATWLMTIPTADVMSDGDYALGVIQGGAIPFHGDIGALWDGLQVGVHGVKLRMLEEGKPWAGLAVGATFGYYPSGVYLVGSKRVGDLRLHLGTRFLPFTFSNDTDDMNADSVDDTFEVFGGVEKSLAENRVRAMLEVSDTLGGGVRFDVSPRWNFDVGVRVGLPERIRKAIGDKGEAYAFTSKDATAYVAFTFLSNWRELGPPEEIASGMTGEPMPETPILRQQSDATTEPDTSR